MHDEMHGMCANVWKCDHLSVALATGWHSAHDRDIHLLDSAVLNYCYYCKLLLFFSAKFHCMERVVEYWRESPSRFFFLPRGMASTWVGDCLQAFLDIQPFFPAKRYQTHVSHKDGWQHFDLISLLTPRLSFMLELKYELCNGCSH